MDPVRQHLLAALKGGLAYDTFDSILNEFTSEDRGRIPQGAEHSPWQILEHMRIALRDIIDFCRNEAGGYQELKWPDEYWPTSTLPSTDAWTKTLEAYKSDLAEFVTLVADPANDLFAPFLWGEGQTLMREALLVTDHAAYHLGQLVELKRWLDKS